MLAFALGVVVGGAIVYKFPGLVGLVMKKTGL